MPFSMWHAKSAGIPSNFSRTKSPGTVHNVKIPFAMIARIMAAGNGAHLHHRIHEIYVLDSKDQRIGLTVILSHKIIANGTQHYKN